MFFFHVAHIFDLDLQASLKNRETSVPLSAFTFFADQWLMHILFLAAGSSAWYALQTRTRSGFLRERLARLIVPLLFGTFVLIPWHGYVSAQSHGTFQGSYLAFLPVHFAGIWSAMSWSSTFFFVTSWHLWFLGDLFVFSVVGSFCFSLAASRNRLRKYRLCLLALPIVVIKLIFDASFPSHTDWSETLVWFTLYWYGWLFMRDGTLWPEVESQAWRWLAAGLCCVGLLGMAFQKGYLLQWLDHPAYTWDYGLYQIFAAVNTWAWVMAISGLCLRWFNFDHWLLRVLGPAALPFYILHQTAIFTTGFWIVQTRWPVAFKFITIAVSSFFATILVYQLLVRRIGILRPLFGMRAAGSHIPIVFSKAEPVDTPSNTPSSSSRQT